MKEKFLFLVILICFLFSISYSELTCENSGGLGYIDLSFDKTKVQKGETVNAKVSMSVTVCDGKSVYVVKDDKSYCSGLRDCIANCYARYVDPTDCINCIKGCEKTYGGCHCTLKSNSCECSFIAPDTVGTHNYYACIDKNNDLDFDDLGETKTKTLEVISVEVTSVECLNCQNDKIILKKSQTDFSLKLKVKLSTSASGTVKVDCVSFPTGVTCGYSGGGSCSVSNQDNCEVTIPVITYSNAQSGTLKLEAKFGDSKKTKDIRVEICGIKDSVCCENNQCEQGLICKDNKCVECGKENLPCCQNNQCEQGLVCRNGKCVKEEICSGSISFSFSKDKVKPKESVTASFSGISCSKDVAIYLAKDSKENCNRLRGCIVNCGGNNECIINCWRQYNGCSCITKSTCSCNFEAPQNPGEYTYYACVDKNDNGNFDDPGETATQKLIVSTIQITIKTQDKVVIKRGTQTKIGVSIELSEQSSGRINLKCTNVPQGISCTDGSCDVNNQRSCNIELTLSASNNAQSGIVTLEASFQDSKASKDLTLEICGIKDSVCCENNQCEQGLICKDNKCVECGKENLPCCQNNQCEQGLICDTGIGKCMKSLCGGEGQQCCENNRCNEGLICDPNSKKCKKLILKLEPREKTITLTLPPKDVLTSGYDYLNLVLDANPDPKVAVTDNGVLEIEKLPQEFSDWWYRFSCEYGMVSKSDYNCKFEVGLKYKVLCSLPESGEIVFKGRVQTKEHGWVENTTKIKVEINRRNVVSVVLTECMSSAGIPMILGISINKPLDEKWFGKSNEDNFCIFKDADAGRYYLCEVKDTFKFVEVSVRNGKCNMKIVYPDCKQIGCEKISFDETSADAKKVCPSCTKNEDCPKGYKCLQGRCIKEEEQIVKVYISSCLYPINRRPTIGIAVNTQLEDKWWEGKQQNVCVYKDERMDYECKFSGTFRHAEVSVKDAKCDVSIVYPDGRKFDCRGISWDEEWGGPKVCPEKEIKECGKENLPCCQNNQCEQGLVCDPNSKKCVKSLCGGEGQQCCENNRCNEGLVCENGKCIKKEVKEAYRCKEEDNTIKVEKCSGNECKEVYSVEKRSGKKISKCLKDEGNRISEVLTMYYEIDCIVKENKIICNFFGVDLSSVSKFCILSDVCFNLPKKT